VLHNFKGNGSRYLMIANQPHVERNEEILFTGSYRAVNLHLPRFNFPKPLWSVDDAQGEGDRAVTAIFELEKIDI
jgi:hypothetical protein